jgi:hypothetical protein
MSTELAGYDVSKGWLSLKAIDNGDGTASLSTVGGGGGGATDATLTNGNQVTQIKAGATALTATGTALDTNILRQFGTARTQATTGTAASVVLTTTCRGVSLLALTADMCFAVSGTATTSSHYLAAGERIDFVSARCYEIEGDVSCCGLWLS